MKTYFVGMRYVDGFNGVQVGQAIIEAEFVHTAAILFLEKELKEPGLALGPRQEQPWTDQSGRFFSITSFYSTAADARVWVYEQIGGFENTLRDVRDWNP